MLNRTDLDEDQLDCIAWLAEGYRGAVLADLGTGKTVIAETHVNDVQDFPALVISTTRVCDLVWEQEAQQWEHLQHLRFEHVTGKPVERTHALYREAEFYLINIENIQWLMDQDYIPDFQVVILDELSLWRGMGKRWKAVRNWLADDVVSVIGLTGTPATNGYEGLWPQMELIEKGALGRTMTLYRQKHFWQNVNNPHKLMLQPNAENKIFKLMDPHVFRLTNEGKGIPGIREYNIPASIMPKKGAQMINEFRRESYLKVESSYADFEISGDSAASAVNKLVQMGNGSVYTDTGEVMHVHDGKLIALREYISELQGAQAIIAYWYKHDRSSMAHWFSDIEWFDGDLTRSEAADMEAAWNAGEIQLMGVHPGSGGHGLNLQKSHAHHLCWYSMTWDLDLYDQLIGRLARKGNGAATIQVGRIIAGREDLIISRALSEKTDVQTALLEAYER